MGKNQEKDELEEVETISREQAEKEMQSAVEKLHSKQSHGSPKKTSHSGTGKGEPDEKDELADVETIPRQQAEKEMHEAAGKVKKDKKKGS